MFAADDRKIPDYYAYPPELHDELDQRLDLRTIPDVISHKETMLVKSSHEIRAYSGSFCCSFRSCKRVERWDKLSRKTDFSIFYVVVAIAGW